jgi:hypothetical protein
VFGQADDDVRSTGLKPPGGDRHTGGFDAPEPTGFAAIFIPSMGLS